MKTIQKITRRAEKIYWAFWGLDSIKRKQGGGLYKRSVELEFLQFCAMRELVPNRKALRDFAKFHNQDLMSLKSIFSNTPHLALDGETLERLESYGMYKEANHYLLYQNKEPHSYFWGTPQEALEMAVKLQGSFKKVHSKQEAYNLIFPPLQK